MTRQGRGAAMWWLRSRHERLMYAAARLRRKAVRNHQQVVMVVGSYGKTTTTRAARAALGLPSTAWSELNANTLGEVAWSLLREPPWRRHTVIEAGAAVPGQIARYAEVVGPHATVVTWLGHEHLQAFGDLERLRDEKAAAVRALPAHGTAILNADDPHVRWMATQTRARVVWFGTSAECDVRADQVELDWPHGMRIRVSAAGQSFVLRTRLLGRRTVHNLLAAVAVGLNAGRPLQAISAGLSELAPTRGRLQGTVLANGATLIRDEYKATPETVVEALRLLAEVPARRRIVVIGDLNNLPSTPVEPHFEAIGAKIGQVADLVVVVGSRVGDYLVGLRRAGLDDGQVWHAVDTHAAIDLLRDTLAAGDVVLLKGQEDQRLGRIALGLQRPEVRCARTTCRAYLQLCDDCPLLCRAA